MKPALERLPAKTKLLEQAVAGLELILLTAETLEDPKVARCKPFAQLIWLYATAMHDVLRATRPDGRTLWNAPALAALCRPLQDAFLSLRYFGVEEPSEEDAEFRVLLLERHKIYKRLDLVNRHETTPAVEQERAMLTARLLERQQALLAHPFFAKLDKTQAGRIANEKDRYLVEPAQEIWVRAGLDRGLYDVLFRYFSQFAHATPYAADELLQHRAGEEEGAVRMVLPVSVALICTSSAVHSFAELHPSLDEKIPPSFRKYMDGELE